MNDLPLPPPPSPTQLQQYEIYNNINDSQHTRTLSSLSSMSTGSNTTHSSSQSLSPTPYNYHHNNNTIVQQQQQQQQQQMTHFQPQNETTYSSLVSLDQYGSNSPLHSRQASSSSSSLNYNCNSDNYGTLTASATTTIPPPPPPPLPEDNNEELYINTMKQQHNTNNRKLLMTKQNENDMNTYNKTNVTSAAMGGGGGVGNNTVTSATTATTITPIVPTTQKVYNKFLKEYSNKLLTQGNNNNNNNTNSITNTLKHSDNVSNNKTNSNNNINSFINNGTPKPFIASSSNSPKQTQQQHNHYLQQQQQLQQQTNNCNNNNNNSNIINNSLPSVAAITATLNNQLKFDSCQVAPPPTPLSTLPTSTATTTIKTPSSSNLSIVDKSPFNINNSSNNNQIINDLSNNNNNNTTTTTNEMSTTMATGPSGDKPFEYVTLTGNVIRSVVPPGKGNVNYKVNQGGYARPYGAAPPAAAPKSPVSYPPQQQQQWNQPPPTQPKPSGVNAYATLPRNNVGQQEEEENEESLQPQYAECYFEEDYEVDQANRPRCSKFSWPPAEEDNQRAPTAAPLYIAPPETQHVVAKPIENPPPPPPGNAKTCGRCECSGGLSEQQQQQQIQQQQQHQQQQLQQQHQQQQQAHWVSRSAPQLTSRVTQQQQLECESSSDSYTSTSTTTTTTSEEYQRMYAAQVQAYQMQQAYEQSGSEFDYHMDMEVAAMQQQDHLQLSSSHYSESGRRSAQECIETLVPPLSTYRLVDMVREVTPSPVPETSTQGSRHVVFLEEPEVKEVDKCSQQQQQEQQVQQQQTASSSYASNLTQATKSSQSMAYATSGSATTSTKIDVQEVIEEVTDELEHSEVIFPPPSPLSHLKPRPSSGLHRPESIPKYQRNWTVLPTQSPCRTPEPPELRENIPLAFVDTPKAPSTSNGSNGNTVHKPVAQMSARSVSQQQSQSQSHQQQTTASAYSSSVMSSKTEQRQQQLSSTVTSSSTTASDSVKQQLQLTKPTIPIIVEDRSGPVTMAFQALDEHMVRDQSQTPSRPYTPSMINKPAPITPYYQTPEKLCFDECPATHARDYDRRSASPFPDRAKSPAPGPPPNPLAAIRAPRLKETELSPLSPRVLQTGSITTGQSYLGAQQAQLSQQERLLSHSAAATQSAMQTYIQEPEKRETKQIGNMTVERSEKASRLEEQKQSQMQSHTKTQVGNTQIERRRKVTEEFEHTSSAKTVEIRTGSQSSTTERRQSYGKTGYVANQARRLSGLEQEITNLTSQSQAISARAATLTETKFPELHSPSGGSKFPTKPVLSPNHEPEPPCYIVSGSSNKKLSESAVTSFPPAQQQKQMQATTCGTSLVSAQQSQSLQQQQQQKSLTTLSTTSCSYQQQQANTVSSSLTKASATTCTNNQAYQSITAGSNHNATSTSSATGSTPMGVCPVTGTFCRPGHTCCKQQILQQTNNNGSRPTASLGSAGTKPTQAPPASSSSVANTQAQAQSAAPTASKRPSVSAPSNNNNNNNDSTTGGLAPKGGAYGATSAPKRGRGILNKAVSPGVRVPLCNSCGTHIRGPFITALGKIWCPEHFHCVNGNCRRPLQDIGFVEEKGDLYCEYCFEKYLAPTCSKCVGKIKGDCLNAIGKHFHPECFACGHCGKLFGNTPFFLEDGIPYCEADWNELFTTKCYACGFPVEAGDRWVEALNHNYHSQCFNCTYCKQNLEGQSFYNKGGRPFCKNHAR